MTRLMSIMSSFSLNAFLMSISAEHSVSTSLQALRTTVLLLAKRLKHTACTVRIVSGSCMNSTPHPLRLCTASASSTSIALVTTASCSFSSFSTATTLLNTCAPVSETVASSEAKGRTAANTLDFAVESGVSRDTRRVPIIDSLCSFSWSSAVNRLMFVPTANTTLAASTSTAGVQTVLSQYSTGPRAATKFVACLRVNPAFALLEPAKVRHRDDKTARTGLRSCLCSIWRVNNPHKFCTPCNFRIARVQSSCWEKVRRQRRMAATAAWLELWQAKFSSTCIEPPFHSLLLTAVFLQDTRAVRKVMDKLTTSSTCP
mmetsp:Transcript_2710/g.5151  ORF Transcript_2710/g.5151 Transcript_2710/m.5151 type:complete len:316 (+) Transcript_2710:866-1813(+)